MQGWLVPQGREAPLTYWIRRVIVLTTLVIIILVLIIMFHSCGALTASAPSGDDAQIDAASPNAAATPAAPATPGEAAGSLTSPQPADTKAPQPSTPQQPPLLAQSDLIAPVTDVKLPDCSAADVEIGVSGPNPVKVDQPADFTIKVTAKKDCQLSPNQLDLAIVSGPDHIWSTSGCKDWSPQGDKINLANGDSHEFAVNWPVKRAYGCDIVQKSLGAGTYIATGSLGNTSKRFVFMVQR